MSGKKPSAKTVIFLVVWLILAIVASLPSLATDPKQLSTQEPESETLHIAVIGASVSAGYGLDVRLSEVLDAAIGDRKTITDLSSALLFLNPLGYANEVGQKLKKDAPSVVIGIDFLFWFAYGEKDFNTRKKDLQQALRLLEKLKCYIVVGDLPKFSESENIVLGSNAIPSDEELRVLNRIIQRWGKKNKKVTIFPLCSIVESIKKGEPIEINGVRKTYRQEQIFQPDGVHATQMGLISLAAIVLEKLSDDGCPLADSEVLLDPNLIAAKMNQQNKPKLPK